MFKDTGKKRLSKGILDMKFMQRTKEKVRKELIDEEGRELFSCLMTEEMRSGISNCIIEQSYIRCEDLIEGRLSFQGMNPELERLLELERLAKNPIPDNSDEVDITDQEMAAYKSSLVKTMASKFTKKMPNKREQKMKWESEEITPPPAKKKKKFLKPKDE